MLSKLLACLWQERTSEWMPFHYLSPHTWRYLYLRVKGSLILHSMCRIWPGKYGAGRNPRKVMTQRRRQGDVLSQIERGRGCYSDVKESIWPVVLCINGKESICWSRLLQWCDRDFLPVNGSTHVMLGQDPRKTQQKSSLNLALESHLT